MVGTARLQPPVPDQPHHRLMDSIVEQHFWARIDLHGKQIPHMDTRCWAWTGSKTNGYGSVPTGVTKQWVYAHRFSYELHYSAPNGMVCHHCDNRECCNPEHLYDGDASTNAKDLCARNPSRVAASRKVDAVVLAEMRSMAAQGSTYRAIGKKLGLSDVTVRNWLKGKYIRKT